MKSTRIQHIEFATLVGHRPRSAGCNARLGVHGDRVRMPVVRLTTNDGVSGFGRSSASPELLRQLMNQPLESLISGVEVLPAWKSVEFPLIDLMGRIQGKPIYRLAGTSSQSARVRTYDTSLYFDDLHIAEDQAAAFFIASEAHQGWERGHRAFKIKVGRGARHMSLDDGTRRDIAVIHEVRNAVGPDALVMIDANNGWNLNLTKHVLSVTRSADIYWLEEPFHEDDILYVDLKDWMEKEGLSVRIADGEGAAHPSLMHWATGGVIDVIQYDMVAIGFGAWKSLGYRLDDAGVATAPHTYGNGFGHIATSHLATVVRGLEPVEWDEAHFDGIDATAWTIREGWVDIPEQPGFGLELDEGVFETAVMENGSRIRD